MKFNILATGPSMSQEIADSLQGERAVVVSDAYKLAPWAEAMASQDSAWWCAHPDAKQFAGRKFSGNRINGGVETITCEPIRSSSSSGVLALEVAKKLGATEIHLHGFDMKGSHYFGPHEAGLQNTTPARFEVFQKQFQAWGKMNPQIKVINKTPGSALRAFHHE